MIRITMAALAATVVLVLAASIPGRAAPVPQVSPQDRAAVESCLALVAKRRETATAEPAGATPEARLDAAAAEARSQPESCIGIVSGPCQDEPGGGTTRGMVDCADRERAVWDQRLNKTFQAAVTARDPKLVEALRQAERAWIAYRDARCALPAVENEGGSIVGPLTAMCLLDATARQAIWLEGIQ